MAKPESSLMLSDTALVNDRVIVMPQNGTSVVINPEPGAYTQFLFKLDQVSAVNLRPDGQLEMKLANNSTMVIANFQDLVNSAKVVVAIRFCNSSLINNLPMGQPFLKF
jgi:hypothetical protein